MSGKSTENHYILGIICQSSELRVSVGGLYGIQFHHGRIYLPYNYIIKYFICKFITGCVIIVFENYF